MIITNLFYALVLPLYHRMQKTVALVLRVFRVLSWNVETSSWLVEANAGFALEIVQPLCTYITMVLGFNLVVCAKKHVS